MKRVELIEALDQLLTPWKFKDYAPNGLQVEGRSDVSHIVTAVTAGQSAIDAAINMGADTLLVHHGYFWKGESQVITGMKRNRIKALLDNDINLIGYHLPLDAHPTLGNNARLAQSLGLELCGPMELGNELSIPVWGRFESPVTESELCQRVEQALGRVPLCISGHDRMISTLGICSGGAPDYIDLAASLGLDGYLSGEVAERTYYSAREQGVSYFAAGHHATERGGVQALGHHLADQFGLKVTFVDCDNPV